MSTELELPHELPKTRIPTRKSTLTSITATSTASSSSRTPHHHHDDKLIIEVEVEVEAEVDSHVNNNNSAAAAAVINKKKKSEEDEDGEGDDDNDKCRTPTSGDSRIPEKLSCPPAPRKPRRVASSMACKRKLMNEFQFFEILNRDEVEAFFGSNFAAKRRCVRCKSKP